MKNKYVVLYKRDVKTEKTKGYGNKMLFDKMKDFYGLNEARAFHFNNLPGILMQNAPFTDIDRSILEGIENPFVVVGEFYGKYGHCDYLGDCDPLRTYDAVRCSADEINKLVEAFSREGKLERVIVGLERGSVW